MATLPPKELLVLWSREQLSVEMATGHLLQHLVAMQTTHEALKQAISLLQGQINTLMAASQSPSAAPTHKKSSRRRS